MSECKLKIGITQGDPNGIGWEVILKALSDPRMTELFTPVVYGSPTTAAYYRNTLGDTEPVAFNTVPAARDARRGKANLVVCGEAGQPEPGKASPQAGRAAVEALRTATRNAPTTFRTWLSAQKRIVPSFKSCSAAHNLIYPIAAICRYFPS